MGQPFPQYQNGQFPQGLPGALPQQGVLGQQAGMNPLQAAAMAQGIPGVDPRMMAQAQQQVANPNGGDALNIFPGPKEMAIGAVAGVTSAYGLSALMGQNFDGALPETAKWIDNVPWVRKFSDWAEKHYQTLGQKHPWIAEGLLTKASSVPLNEKNWQKYAQDAVSEMEERHIKTLMDKFPNRFDDKLRNAYHGAYLTNHKDKIIDAYNEHVRKNFEDKIKGLTPGTEDYEKVVKGRDAKLLNKTDEFFNFAQKDAKWLKGANFETTLNQAKAQVHYLENVKGKLTPDEAKILQRLKGVKERIVGLNRHYKPVYEGQARLTAKMAAEGVGPVGRFMGLTGQYLQRIFNGETLSMGSKSFLSMSLMGPMLAGGFIFGMSAQKAKNAKEGEKTKTFFHDFFGTGIANFVGWELGKKWLNSTGIVHKVLGKFSTKRPFDNAVGRYIPIFGEGAGKATQSGLQKIGANGKFANFMGKVAGKGIGGWFARLTLGTLATELIAMFAIGSAFQFVGEKVAHLIFGKPSQESIDGKGKQKSQQQPGNPQMMPQAGQSGYPAQMGNPAIAAAQPMRQATFNGQNMAMPGQSLAQQTMPQPGAQPKAMPAFSLSPAQISQSTASKGMQSLESQIMTDYGQRQKKSNGRINYFDPNSF